MTAQDFFSKYPTAPVCFVVGDQVYNGINEGAAREHSVTTATEMVTVQNPGFTVANPIMANVATTHAGEGASLASKPVEVNRTADKPTDENGDGVVPEVAASVKHTPVQVISEVVDGESEPTVAPVAAPIVAEPTAKKPAAKKAAAKK